MKRFLKFLPLLFAAVAAMTLWSCADANDDDQPIPAEELPTAAQTFISTYYPKAKVYSVEVDNDGYEAVLSNGHQIDFNLAGEWTDVEAPAGQVIPSGFYPADIDTYVSTNFPGSGINEISVTMLGYDVDLISGVELLFDAQGQFIGVDL